MKKFNSKISYPLVIAIFIVYAAIMYLPLYNKDGLAATLTMAAIIVPLIILTSLLFFNTSYTITDTNSFKIHSGFFQHASIDIDRIQSIRSTRSIMSAPAPAFDRIEIKYGKWDSIIISPKDKKAFVKMLLEINPSIDVEL